MQNPNEIIDLTSLDYYSPCKKRRVIHEGIIDLVNESFNTEETKISDKLTTSKRKPKVNGSPMKTTEKDKDRNCTKGGLCSICWEKLGKNPLASTKCGHVYCLICLENSLKCNKRCPTCRCILKGPSAYHPLYLEIGYRSSLIMVQNYQRKTNKALYPKETSHDAVRAVRSGLSGVKKSEIKNKQS